MLDYGGETMTLGVRDLGDRCQCCRKDGNSAFEHQLACSFRMSGAENQLPHLLGTRKPETSTLQQKGPSGAALRGSDCYTRAE